MSETPSTMIPLGTVAPDFNLLDVSTGKLASLNSLKSKQATVVMFICNHCPYVQHILAKLIEVAKTYQKKEVSFIAINSNDVKKYPGDSPEKMRDEARDRGFTFPYLYDETQTVAQAYQAACTPDFYIFDQDLKCVYRGRFDGATPGNAKPVTGAELSAALDSLLANEPVSSQQNPSMGCNIKWKENASL